MTILVKANIVSVTLKGMFFLPLALHGATSWLSSTSGKATLLFESEGRKHRSRLTQNTSSPKTKTSTKGLGSLPALCCHFSSVPILSAPNLWEVSMHTYLHPHPPPRTPGRSASYPSLPLCHTQIFRCSDACDLPPLRSRDKHGLCCPTLMCKEGLYDTAHPNGEQIASGSWTAQSYLVRDGLAFRHRTAIQARKDCGRSPNPTKLGQLDQGARGLVLPLPSISEDGPSGPEPCAHAPGFDHPHGENTFPNMPCSCCLSSQQCMSLRGVCLHLL